jgi:hypothetical protein
VKALLKTVSVPSVLATEASSLCQWLADWLMAPDLATLDQVDGQFAKLIIVIDAIPPTVADRGVIGYLRNRYASSLVLRSQGEYHPAAYQLREMGLKLARL